MANKKRIKTLYMDINIKKGNFISKIAGLKSSQDFSDIKLLRNLLTNEKSRILYILKTKNPKSIYELSKILKRDFKSTREDLKVLERFGLIEFISEKNGKRKSLVPILKIDGLNIQISI